MSTRLDLIVGEANIAKPLKAFVLTSGDSVIALDQSFESPQPIVVENDEIEVNEEQLQENHIYPFIYRGRQFYLQMRNGITEIFELTD